MLRILHSNPFRMFGICIRMLRISFEWFKFGFERLESLWNGSNSHSNDSNPYFKFAFEWLESLSNGSNMHSNASNHIQMAGICIRIVRICFEWFEFALECFESRSNGSNLL